MRSVEEIKAVVRSRFVAYMAAHPTAVDLGFVHGDYLVEEICDDLIGNTTVKSFYNPTVSLPANPQELDRYIASATGAGWTVNNVYTRIGSDWLETTFAPGVMICYIEAEDEWYGAYTDGWKSLASGATTQSNPIYLNDYWRIIATETDFQVQTKVGETWVKKQRIF